MKLLLIRHAESDNNYLWSQLGPEGYWASRSADPTITERGFEQADALARHMEKVDYGITDLFVSPMLRTVQTARPTVEALSLQPRLWIDIHEDGGLWTSDPADPGNFGNHPGITRAEFIRDHPEFELVDGITDDGWWTLGREDRAGCCARAMRVASELTARADAERDEGIDSVVALVSHGAFLDMLVHVLFGQLPSAGHFYELNNTSLTLLDFPKPGRVVVKYLNRTEHLTPDLITL